MALFGYVIKRQKFCTETTIIVHLATLFGTLYSSSFGRGFVFIKRLEEGKTQVKGEVKTLLVFDCETKMTTEAPETTGVQPTTKPGWVSTYCRLNDWNNVHFSIYFSAYLWLPVVLPVVRVAYSNGWMAMCTWMISGGTKWLRCVIVFISILKILHFFASENVVKNIVRKENLTPYEVRILYRYSVNRSMELVIE